MGDFVYYIFFNYAYIHICMALTETFPLELPLLSPFYVNTKNIYVGETKIGKQNDAFH